MNGWDCLRDCVFNLKRAPSPHAGFHCLPCCIRGNGLRERRTRIVYRGEAAAGGDVRDRPAGPAVAGTVMGSCPSQSELGAESDRSRIPSPMDLCGCHTSRAGAAAAASVSVPCPAPPSSSVCSAGPRGPGHGGVPRAWTRITEAGWLFEDRSTLVGALALRSRHHP